jgi:hypothetical protein
MKRFTLSIIILIVLLIPLIFGARFAGTLNKNPAEILRKEAFSQSIAPFSNEILLGEAISVLGDPLYADVCLARAFDSQNHSYDYSPMTLITFKSGPWLSAQSRQPSSRWSISPDMTVISLSYAFPIRIRSPWQGFRDKPDIPGVCGIE